MQGRCATIVGLIALAACGSSAGKTAPGTTNAGPLPAVCGPAGARTLAVDRAARAYQSGSGVYGCSAAARRSYLLGASARSIREGRAGPIALAGSDVAYGYTRFGIDTVSAQVVVRDLASGKQLHSEPATSRPLGPEFFQSVATVVVKPDGAVAWIGDGGSIIAGRTRDIEVDRAEARGFALLESGAGIDARSLRLRGSTLTWRDGARTRSARLD